MVLPKSLAPDDSLHEIARASESLEKKELFLFFLVLPILSVILDR